MLNCRFCATPLTDSFVDLGSSPIANAYLSRQALDEMEPFYPLHVYVCNHCLLVQLPPVCLPEHLFDAEYAYFSSFSESWLNHAKTYANRMMERFNIGSGQRVVEVASNDGYLLQYFLEAGVSVLGIEPAENCAEAARAKGVSTEVRFFGTQTAGELLQQGHAANLMAANNVLAHVPDINDFVEGFRILLVPDGVATFEFPHLLNLIVKNEFDTIYHEHYSYLSLYAVEQIFKAHGLAIFDVEELETHGGSLRLYAQHTAGPHPQEPSVQRIREKETQAGLNNVEGYRGFEEKVRKVKRDLLRFLIEARHKGKTVAAYGAPAKGNTLLNYCGVRGDLLDYTVDRSPHKQGRFLPGTRIPIFPPAHILETRPDFVLILPWNLQTEIMGQMETVRSWGGQFVVPIPELKILP